MGGLPVTAIFISIWRRTQVRRGILDMLVHRGGILNMFLMLLFFMMVSLYALARAYLVVKCFINVDNLPPGVYEVPRWATNFSHIA